MAYKLDPSLTKRFSALQRAENSSINLQYPRVRQKPGFSALQRAENSSIAYEDLSRRDVLEVSVLFSEPKIPQSSRRISTPRDGTRFQCSSASRKFLN